MKMFNWRKERVKFEPSDEPYVWNTGAQAVLDVLNKLKFVVIKGYAGVGKTATAKAVVKKYKEQHPGCEVLVLSEISDFEQIVDPTKDTLIMVDDVLGERTGWRRGLDKKGHSFESVHACISCAEVKAVFCCRKDILDDAWISLMRHKLFQEENVIDLSTEEYKLTESNKREILEKHCAYNKISFCLDKKDCNYQNEMVIKEKLPARITEDMKQQILQMKPLIGYLKSVELFTSDRGYLSLGLDFFKSPQDVIMKELLKYRENMERPHYTIMIYMLLNNGKFDRGSMNEDLLKQVRETEMGTKIPLRRFDIRDSLEELENRYVVKDNSGDYTFSNDQAREAVAICYCEDYPKYAFKVVDFNILQKYAKCSHEKEVEHEVVIPVEPQNYPDLVERFLMEQPLWSCVNNRMMDDTQFVDEFFKIGMATKESATKVENSCRSRRGMLTKACIYGKLNFLNKMWDIFSEKLVPFFGECLTCAARNDKVDVVAWLLTRGGDEISDDQLSTAISDACRFGSYGSVKLMFEFREIADIKELERGLNQACFGGHVEIINFMLSTRPDFTLEHKREAMAWSVVGGYMDALDTVFYSTSELANHDYMSITKYKTTVSLVHIAAYFGRSAVFEKLLSSGMTCESHDGKVTALQSAMFGFKTAASDYDAASSYTLCRTDLMGCYTTGLYDAFKKFPPVSEYCQIMEFILDHPEREDATGVDIRLDKANNTLVHYCVINNALSLLTKLIDMHPDLVLLPNNQGTVPIQLAVFLGRCEIVPSLLSLGVQKVPGGMTSLKNLLSLGLEKADLLCDGDLELPGILNCLDDCHLPVKFGGPADYESIQKLLS